MNFIDNINDRIKCIMENIKKEKLLQKETTKRLAVLERIMKSFRKQKGKK